MAAGYGSHFQDREEGPEEAGEVHSGGGVILWHQGGVLLARRMSFTGSLLLNTVLIACCST